MVHDHWAAAHGAVTFALGAIPVIYGSLCAMVALQTLNGWLNGMGWPPCGKMMIQWWSTKERGVIVSVWVAHNLGGALVATFAAWGVARGLWPEPPTAVVDLTSRPS